ncbi:hypothetical protein J1614_011701 [Plenodomus biglobosus]|nr:hypothetical protein J1614_011701 [Plenodomus biglobosus]
MFGARCAALRQLETGRLGVGWAESQCGKLEVRGMTFSAKLEFHAPETVRSSLETVANSIAEKECCKPARGMKLPVSRILEAVSFVIVRPTRVLHAGEHRSAFSICPQSGTSRGRIDRDRSLEDARQDVMALGMAFALATWVRCWRGEFAFEVDV